MEPEYKLENQINKCSIIIPVLNEPETIKNIIDRIDSSLDFKFEFLIIADNVDDQTIPHLSELETKNGEIRLLLNLNNPGFSNAIKFGMKKAESPIVVVTMADGSDDPSSISPLVALVERGVTIACASRYIATGQQIGAPFMKGVLARIAGKSFHFLTRVGTHDCTNNFKAYSKQFLDAVDINASTGFEIGMELIAKAKRGGMMVAEIPTIWIERTYGKSNFKILSQIGSYLKWFLHGIGIGKSKTLLHELKKR